MDIEIVLSFLLASIALSLMPGPDNIYVLTESITRGKQNGIALSAGLSSGVIIHTIIIATGLSIVLEKYPSVFFGIKMFGALYLFYLVYLTYKEEKEEPIILESDSSKNSINFHFFKLFKKGFLMNVLNPKVTLFFIAFLPQFVSKNGLSFQLQIGILGIIFMIQAFIVFGTISIIAEKFSKYLKSEMFWKNVKWIKMIVLIILGIFIILP